MKSNPKREPIPQDEVIAWLTTNHPEIKAEPDRAWLWIATDLRSNKAVRDSLKAYGFRYAAAGHKLASGTISYWGHSCDRPKAFKRKGNGNGQAAPKSNGSRKASRPQPSDTQRADPMEYTPQPQTLDDQTMAELAAAFA